MINRAAVDGAKLVCLNVYKYFLSRRWKAVERHKFGSVWQPMANSRWNASLVFSVMDGNFIESNLIGYGLALTLSDPITEKEISNILDGKKPWGFDQPIRLALSSWIASSSAKIKFGAFLYEASRDPDEVSLEIVSEIENHVLPSWERMFRSAEISIDDWKFLGVNDDLILSRLIVDSMAGRGSDVWDVDGLIASWKGEVASGKNCTEDIFGEVEAGRRNALSEIINAYDIWKLGSGL